MSLFPIVPVVFVVFGMRLRGAEEGNNGGVPLTPYGQGIFQRKLLLTFVECFDNAEETYSLSVLRGLS
jgi:hypothetical protein